LSKFLRLLIVHYVPVLLIAVLAVVMALHASIAQAATQRSNQVAIVLGEGTDDAGTLQTSGSVAGSQPDSFDSFSFVDVAQEEIQSATLSHYDTVVLNQVFTNSLSEAQKQTLSSFVTSGGKLIIHDADGTEGNSYSWLPVPAETGASCENCGHEDGEARIVENNTIVSNEPSSPYYIDVNEFPGQSDAVGDANVLVSTDPRWDKDVEATNDQNVEGAVDAYAEDGGLILYDGFDTDDIESTFGSGNAWLQKIWYDELNEQWNPSNLPHSTPLVGASGHCGYDSIKVGVVTVCAEHISGTSTETTANGNVVLDGGVAVGGGPVEIDQATKQISVASPVPISLLRGGGPISLGSAAFSIEASGTTDPTSGKGNLAKVSLTSANLGPLGTLRVGNLPFSLPSGSLTLYLDNTMGGGLIGAGTIQLPMVGKLQTSGALSLGFYANSPQQVVALGGAAHFGVVDFGDGWQFNGLDLTYQQPTNTWTASGGLEVPIGSLQASGSVVNGQLNSLQVSIGGQNVPLGDSGFFFSGFGGGFNGLVKGPLSIDASTEGFWGVPGPPVEPFYLDHVTVTVSFGGSVSLDGAVSFALKDHSPLNGQLHLKLNIHPFSATGTASVEGKLPGVSLKAGGGAGFSAKHFTVSEDGSISALGISGGGEVILSDKGVGASGLLCAPHHFYCQSLAFTETWRQLGSLELPTFAGAEPQKLVTVSGVASAGQVARVRVPSGRGLLFIDIKAETGAPEVRLRAPDGHIYSSARSTRTVLFTREPQFGLTTIAVVDPRAGLWRISSVPGEQAVLHISAQTVRSLRLIHAAAIVPHSSSRHPLGARARVLLSWSSAHLPRGVRVTVVRRSQPHEVGVGLGSNLGASGRYSLPVSKLADGPNYLTLAATLNGVPFQEVAFRDIVWRAHPAPKKHVTKKRPQPR
jgi:hypothetical protein